MNSLDINSNNDGQSNPDVVIDNDPTDGEVIIRMTHRWNVDDTAVFVGKEAGEVYDTDYVLKMPTADALEFNEGDVYVTVVMDDEEWHEIHDDPANT